MNISCTNFNDFPKNNYKQKYEFKILHIFYHYRNERQNHRDVFKVLCRDTEDYESYSVIQLEENLEGTLLFGDRQGGQNLHDSQNDDERYPCSSDIVNLRSNHHYRELHYSYMI